MPTPQTGQPMDGALIDPIAMIATIWRWRFIIAGLTLAGDTARVEGTGIVEGWAFDGTSVLDAPDLSPFSALAGRDLAGAASLALNGTVALIGGGHTFGKTHGAGPVEGNIGAEPEAADIEQMGLGWKNAYGEGKGRDTITSGLEVTWTYHPTRWDNEFFHILFAYEWEPTTGEGGHIHWRPKDGAGRVAAHEIMLATPADLEDFALGFALAEGWIAHRGELPGVTKSSW